MSTNTNQTTLTSTQTPPPVSKGSDFGSFGTFQVGMSGLTIDALQTLMNVYTQIANLQQTQFGEQLEAAKEIALNLGDFQKALGVDQFAQYLAQGIGSIATAAITASATFLPGMVKGANDGFGTEKATEELKGVESYQKALEKKLTPNAILKEQGLEPNQEIDPDKAPEVKTRLEQLKGKLTNKESFTADGKAVEVSKQMGKDTANEKGEVIKTTMNDQEVIDNMTKPQAEEAKEAFDTRAKELQKILNQKETDKANFNSGMAQMAGSFGKIGEGSGSAAAAFAVKDQGVDNANVTESQAALQAMQATASQSMKEANDKEQSALQVTQSILAISKANAAPAA